MTDHPPATILLVDDVEMSRYTVAKMLRNARYTVKEAGSGKEALRLALEKPDLVILDVNLPDMSGYEVCNKIKTEPVTASIPVLHLSASFVGSENRVEGLERGADGYLTSPVEPRELVAHIETLLRARRAELEAREQRELLQVTLSSIGDAVVATDLQGRTTFLNPVAEVLTGWAQAAATGRPLSEIFRIVHAGTRQPAESPAALALKEGATVRPAEPLLLQTRDGTETPIECNAAPIRDRDGRLAGVILVFRDVTERLRAEAVRREAEERLRLMVESVKDYAIFSTDPEGRVTSWNAGAERLFRYREDEILGRTAAVLYVPEDVAAGVPVQELRRAAEDGRSEDERWHLRQDQSRFLANGVMTPVREGARLLGFTKVARDVTERKQAEQEIARLLAAEQRQSERLRQLAATSLSVNAALTRESVLRVITEEARRIIGADQAACHLGTDGRWDQNLQVVSWSDNYQAENAAPLSPDLLPLCSLVCGPNRPLRLTREELSAHQVWRKLGAAVPPPRGWLGVPLIGRNGRNLGLIDLSDKYQGDFSPEDESVLVQLALVASVALENAQLYQELRDADQRKDEFLAILAHELRNPLAPIRNALQLIHLADGNEEIIARARALMERQVQVMVRLIDDLLDLSRIARGRIQLRKERVDLAAIVASALETSRTFIEVAGHQLTVQLPDEPVWLLADVTRLSQVVMNLLNNAAKYTDPGGRIWLTAARENNQAVVRVKDTGIGIPADMLGHIFDMFAQVDRNLERAKGGLGIGLTLVRTLVGLHGGSIEAHSAGPDKGSEFVVRLPVAPVSAPGAELSSARRKPARGRPRRILVVDDNRDSAESLSLLLRALGHEVCTAHDGPGAVQAAATFRPDVVLLDIGLPGLNGYEAARLIRGQQEQVVLAAVTGWGQEEDRRRSRESGFDYHLVKPVELETLQDLLAALPVVRQESKAPPSSAG